MAATGGAWPPAAGRWHRPTTRAWPDGRRPTARRATGRAHPCPGAPGRAGGRTALPKGPNNV
eukprot:5399197-Lingulodinium_polyedra.AAC.1